MNRPLHANLMLKKRVTTRLLVTTAVAGLFAFVPIVEGNYPFANVSKVNAHSTTASQIFGDAAPQEDDQLLTEQSHSLARKTITVESANIKPYPHTHTLTGVT